MSKRKMTCKSEKFLTRLPVEATGAMPNIIMEGISKGTWRAQVKSTGIVRPYKSVHDQIKERGEWDEFVAKVKVLPGFELVQDVQVWLEENARDGNIAPLGEEHETDDKLVFIHPGEANSQFLKMGDSVRDANGFSSAQLEALVPRDPNTKPGKKHTLVLHRSGFAIRRCKPVISQAYRKCEIVLDLETGLEISHAQAETNSKQFIMITENCGVFYESVPNKSCYQSSAELGQMGAIISRMTIGELKSLLQKLIRFSAEKIILGNEVHSSEDVLQALMECCVVHAGGFIPNLQSWENGFESFVKRLAVTLVEDAWVDDENLHFLMLLAMIANKDTQFFPRVSVLHKIFMVGHAALNSKRAVIYHREKAGSPIVLKSGLGFLKRASCFLDIRKSFAWDIEMLRDVAKVSRGFAVPGSVSRPQVMRFEHYLDYHASPHVAYYMDPVCLKLAEDYSTAEKFGDLVKSQSQPFAELFRAIFRASSGFNYRRTPDKLKDLDTNEFVQIIRKAQAELFAIQMTCCVIGVDARRASQHLDDKQERKQCNTSNKTIRYHINNMEVASAIGHMKHRVGTNNYYVFVRSVEPFELDVVRVPARKQRDTTILSADKDLAIQAGISQLAKSMKIKSELLGRRVVTLINDQLVLDPPSLVLKCACDVSGHLKILKSAELPILRRLMQLSAGYVKQIEFPKIQRDGSADDKPVNALDIAVFQLCKKMDPILVPKNERYFETSVAWLHVRVEIQEWLQERQPVYEAKWNLFQDLEQRVQTEEQVFVLKTMLERHALGERSHIVIMDTGTGKTLVFGQFLLELFKLNTMPEAVLFTTPKSAIQNVVAELSKFTTQIEVRDMTQKYREERPLRPGFITIMDVDHLRMAENMFDEQMPNVLLVADEFHKSLANTLRTKFMQSAHSSAWGSVALSATPVIDNNIFDLKPLLSMTSKFELTPSNFFVAFSYCIQPTSTLNIKCIEKPVYQELKHDNYLNLLPVNFGGRNENRLDAAQLLHLVGMEQESATQTMLEITVQEVKKGNTVFLVGKNKEHVVELEAKLKNLVSVYVMHDPLDAIVLTEETLQNPVDPRQKQYDVVIAPLSMSAGYTLSICNVLVQTVMASNSSVRHQIRGRIRRLSSKFKEVTYITVVVGAICRLIEFRYEKFDSFATILKDLSTTDKKRKRLAK